MKISQRKLQSMQDLQLAKYKVKLDIRYQERLLNDDFRALRSYTRMENIVNLAFQWALPSSGKPAGSGKSSSSGKSSGAMDWINLLMPLVLKFVASLLKK